jgi:deoxycytidine triphosphate deaminase
MLNSKDLLNVITNITDEKCIQQVGIDLELVEVKKLSGMGMILKEKTILPTYHPVETINLDGRKGRRLEPGYYEVRFTQGCNIPDNTTLKIRQRSSALRSGTQLHSSIFDPGFNTESIGSFIQVNQVIFIEFGARIAQVYGNFNNPVPKDKLYSGQYQQDKQRL